MRRTDLLSGFVDLLWPPVCATCGQSTTQGLCADCRRSLPFLGADACTLCQERPCAPTRTRCFTCLPRRRPLAACVAGVRFEGDPAAWIKRMKYASPWQISFGATERARIRLLARASLDRATGTPPQALVPIPLHRRRLRARGFNPSRIVARELARVVRAPITDRLVRTRDTPSQTGLARAARRRNVAGAFATSGSVPERVWLVDDVVTTGATLEAAARALRRAGAREVIGVCLARTPSARERTRT